MPISNTVLIYGAAAVFVAGVLAVRYVIAPVIVAHGGMPGTVLVLAALYLIGVALDRQ